LPRKVTGEKLEKVISTKISTETFELLEKYARQYYIQNKLKQPTVSRLLRSLINGWLLALKRANEQNNTQGNALLVKSFKPKEAISWNKKPLGDSITDRLKAATNNKKIIDFVPNNITCSTAISQAAVNNKQVSFVPRWPPL
jgi:hypothetical protein